MAESPVLLRAGVNAILEDHLNNIGKRINTWYITAEEKFNFAVQARTKFANGTNQEKKEILATIGSNLCLRDKKLEFDLEIPFFVCKDLVEKVPSVSATFEPKKEAVVAIQMEQLWAKNNYVLLLIDLFRNREIEFGYSLESVKIVYYNLNLTLQNNY